MHSDQNTPGADHPHASNRPQPPEQDQRLGDEAETTSQTVSTPEPDEKRIAEAGNTYTGRQMDDDLKAHPRVEDADDALADEEE